MLITITALIVGLIAGYQYGKGHDKREYAIKQKRKLLNLPKARR